MPEKKLDEILDLIKTIDTKQDKMEERLVQMEKMRVEDNKRIEERFEKVEQNRIEDNKKIEEQFNKIEEKFEQIDQNRIEDNKKIEEQFNKIEEKFEQIDQNRIHDNFYFEQHYWEKITAIFDKIQLEDQLKEIDKEENKKLEKQIELNSAKIMLHESRISKLEKSANF